MPWGSSMPSFFVNSWIIFHSSFKYSSIDGHLSTWQYFLLFHIILKLTLLYVYFGSVYQNFCSTYSQLLEWNGKSKYIHNAILLDISTLSSQNASVIYEVCIVQTRNKHVHLPAQDGAVLFRFTVLMSRQLYVIVLICISCQEHGPSSRVCWPFIAFCSVHCLHSVLIFLLYACLFKFFG